MSVLNNYTDNGKKFYESIGLLVAREVTAEKAAEIAGYSFNTYLELLEKRNISPYIYDTGDYEQDLENLSYLNTR